MALCIKPYKVFNSRSYSIKKKKLLEGEVYFINNLIFLLECGQKIKTLTIVEVFYYYKCLVYKFNNLFRLQKGNVICMKTNLTCELFLRTHANII